MSKTRFEEVMNMDISEFADWISSTFYGCEKCPVKDNCDDIGDDDGTDCIDLILAWLNEVNVPTLIVGDLLELDSGNDTTATGVVASDDMVYITDGRYRCIDLDKLDCNKILAIYRVAPDEEPKLFWERT